MWQAWLAHHLSSCAILGTTIPARILAQTQGSQDVSMHDWKLEPLSLALGSPPRWEVVPWFWSKSMGRHSSFLETAQQIS
jgi:hypothetical protein